jgi:hypothetical protein
VNIRQKSIVQRLERDILLSDGLGPNHVDSYEYKEWEVTEQGRMVFVYSIVGSKTDEGTAAEFLCRTRRHISITHRGRVTLMNARDMRRKARTHSVRKYGYWAAVHELAS